MFTDKIPSWTQQLMGILAPILPPGTYLAGVTALALHLNHRSSFDLDLYSPEKFNVDLQTTRFETTDPNFQLLSKNWQTIHGASKDTEVSLFYYQYPLLEKTTLFNRLKIASIADLACMKLEAIGSRGFKRDFFDLYTICQLSDWNLNKVITLTSNKYQRQSSDVPHLLKSLVYFDDAESKSERAMIVDEQWNRVKDFFEDQVKHVAKELLF